MYPSVYVFSDRVSVCLSAVFVVSVCTLLPSICMAVICLPIRPLTRLSSILTISISVCCYYLSCLHPFIRLPVICLSLCLSSICRSAIYLSSPESIPCPCFSVTITVCVRLSVHPSVICISVYQLCLHFYVIIYLSSSVHPPSHAFICLCVHHTRSYISPFHHLCGHPLSTHPCIHPARTELCLASSPNVRACGPGRGLSGV